MSSASHGGRALRGSPQQSLAGCSLARTHSDLHPRTRRPDLQPRRRNGGEWLQSVTLSYYHELQASLQRAPGRRVARAALTNCH